MKRLLKLAVIGGGLNSTIGQTHIKSINSTGKYKIYCGFFSRNKIINDKSAVEYKIPKGKVYKSLFRNQGWLGLYFRIFSVIILWQSFRFSLILNFLYPISLTLLFSILWRLKFQKKY